MPEKLKDILFPPGKVELFAHVINEVYPSFNSIGFLKAVCDNKWNDLELKEKMRHTTLCLHQFLPQDFQESVEILKAIVPKVTGFESIVLPDYVEVFGMDHWDISLPALGVLTTCGSSEFAIRPFLKKNLDEAMKYMLKWAEDDDYRVRRFASEGCRPRLPWGMGVPALKKDPSLILPILEKLKNDPEMFVRKSVANNLNDISRDHPELALDICTRWYGKTPNTDWIVKHACRTLLKQGNKKAMLLFGFANPDKMDVNDLQFSKSTPRIGEDINFSFNLYMNTSEKQKVRLEYLVHFVKSNKKTSPKVFHIKEIELKPGNYPIVKKHTFKDMSTRKHYPGIHRFEIIINGDKKAEDTIELT